MGCRIGGMPIAATYGCAWEKAATVRVWHDDECSRRGANPPMQVLPARQHCQRRGLDDSDVRPQGEQGNERKKAIERQS